LIQKCFIMLTNCHLIIFSRYPDPGKTKTRLIPVLGPQGAAELQRKMTEKITKQALKIRKNHAVPISLFYTGTTEEKMSYWLGNSFDYHFQCEGDIGKRMGDAFTRTFHHGVRSAVLLGSDIPEITRTIITQGCISLQTEEVVFGPSRDGGYYIIGMRAENAPQIINLLFDRIPWSTKNVLEISVQRLDNAGVSYSLLQTLDDIDRPEDLHIAEALNLL